MTPERRKEIAEFAASFGRFEPLLIAIEELLAENERLEAVVASQAREIEELKAELATQRGIARSLADRIKVDNGIW